MKIQVTIKGKEIKVESSILSYMLTAHSLGLRDWVESEKNGFIKGLTNGVDRETAERNIGYLYDALDTIASHRDANDKLKKILDEACNTVSEA